ncbi:MAG: hypothetical protein ACP5M0_08065 [Desulfomonilaceae bacterium]
MERLYFHEQMWYRFFMKRYLLFVCCIWAGVVCAGSLCWSAAATTPDIRGLWVGSAKGAIFGAEGTVNITYQHGEDIYGIVEGSNFFGKARFRIAGKIRGNYVFGEKDGHTFSGVIYNDGAIRGIFRASDGDTYEIFLQRPYYWGWGLPQGGW